MINVITMFLFNIIVYNIALLYATSGEILIEKSGSLNLGVEGTMAIGAVCGYVAACKTDSLLIGVITAFAAAGLVGFVFAFLTVSLQANQNVTGLTITTFGVAFYYFIGNGLSNSADGWPKINDTTLAHQFRDLPIPLLS
ncbi:MAG: ABC transporter permease, partial [Saccharofermentans sp.]|nr:ABC transporter permease [Saccharofermentans sp.]